MGRVSSPKGPGLFFVLPFIDTFKRVDMRTATFDVPSQEVLTKDAVSITVDAGNTHTIILPFHTLIFEL